MSDDMRPRLPQNNLADIRLVNSVRLTNRSLEFSIGRAATDISNDVVVESSIRMTLTKAWRWRYRPDVSKNVVLVKLIATWRRPFEILDTVIGFDAVQMIPLKAIGAGTNECRQDHAMHKKLFAISSTPAKCVS